MNVMRYLYTIICWETPGPLDALETFESSFSISSCTGNSKEYQVSRHLQLHLTEKFDYVPTNTIIHKKPRNNKPFGNKQGNIACFSSSQPEVLTAYGDFIRQSIRISQRQNSPPQINICMHTQNSTLRLRLSMLQRYCLRINWWFHLLLFLLFKKQ